MFWNWRRYSIRESGILEGMTDCHSHILPGVDDGVKTMNEALQILAEYEQLGITRVHLTPHIMEDLPHNTSSRLKESFESLKSSYHGPIELVLSGEHMLDLALWKMANKNNILTIGDEILIEFPFTSPLTDWESRIHQIADLGHHVVLAHPERYSFISTDDIKRLRSYGIHFQLNLFSIIGVYNRAIQKKANKLLEADYYDYIGSDIHNYESFKRLIDLKKLSIKQISQLKNIKYKVL